MSKNKLPDINKNFSDWYNEIVYQADLAEHSPVRGCVVIKPYGWSIWESIRDYLDKRIKATGHKNASFPLLIPESFFSKEAEHVEGFSPELAVVTHAGGKELEEPLIVRPTSETMIHFMFAKWIKSWRDLPLKINQWANVVRWEMRPRPFLRTSEFFWQEGHTAHATQEEALEETLLMLGEYVNLIQNILAIPVVQGKKSESEKFPGAQETYTMEAIMPDGKALQMGTSHLLAQGFSKAFDIKFQNKEGKLEHPHLTSWGVTTRLIGALIMTHGDEKGLVLPSEVAPIQVVIIPIFKEGFTEQILEKTTELANQLKQHEVRVEIDDDSSKSPGSKFYNWELKGVPLRIELGPKDLEKNQCVLTDRLTSTKEFVNLDQVAKLIPQKLKDIQQEMFNKAKSRIDSQIVNLDKLEDFPQALENGKAIVSGWCGSIDCESKLKSHKATIRCLLPYDNNFKRCFACDKPAKETVLIGRSY